MNPLDQLQDIVLPEQINNYPIAYGWWILALSVIVCLVFIYARVKKNKLKNKAKKRALQTLKQNELSQEDVMRLLKWSALQYFPREQVASLFGKNFQQFLIDSLPEKHHSTFSSLSEDFFSNYYTENNNAETQSAIEVAQFWIENALPPLKNVGAAHHD